MTAPFSPFYATKKLRRAIPLLFGLLIATTACGQSEPRQDDLPKQPDTWVDSITLESDSEVKYVGKTRDFLITSVSNTRDIDASPTVSVGDEIEGIRIGAIKCSFHWRDASYSGEQYMWRGRWACMAGTNRQEVENAVGSEGEKRFDYIHVAPVTLDRSTD